MMVMFAHPFIWSGALVAGLCGVALLAWALFADRARGRRRCGRCWYPMDHAASLRCPECGHEAKNDRGLYRTRRRWKWAAASLLPLLLAAFLAVQPKVQQDGWGSIVPATVMILLLRVDDRQWVIDGIEYHINSEFGAYWSNPNEEQLWRWQWRMLARSILMRMEDEERIAQRESYHRWLSVCADAGGDAALRQECMDALIRELSHPNWTVRDSAAFLSVDYDNIEGSIKLAIGLLDHEDDRTRFAGITILGQISRLTGQGVPALIDALQCEDARVRMLAIWAIGATAKRHGPFPEAFDAVYALEHDENGRVRYQRIVTLADLQSDDEAWKTIDAALHHDDPHVRRGGLVAAAERQPRPPHVCLRMIECLGDPDATVRRDAALMLDFIDADVLREHAELLQSFLSHDDPDVRRTVRLVLQRIR
ncbi:MAG: HEAT repeat domain-containing protein [Phycisphaerales bacterium]|nr:MAG: HEAT repeat domain-containing protein [Phycisphaerales bacterium]